MASSFARFRQHPWVTALCLVLVFVLWTLPQWLASLWPVLVSNRTIPEWLSEHRWPFMTASVYGWLSLVVFVLLLGGLVIVVKAFIASPDPPIHVTRYGVAQLVTGKPIVVRLFYQTDAPKVKVSLTYFLSVAEEPPPERRPDWMKAAPQVWDGTMDGPPAKALKQVEITVPKGEHYFELVGGVLTPPQAKGFKSGRGALYIMGRLRYSNGHGGTIEFCALTQDGVTVALAPSRNGPAD